MYIHEQYEKKRGRVKFYDPHHTFYDPKTNPNLRNNFSNGSLFLLNGVSFILTHIKIVFEARYYNVLNDIDTILFLSK